jgi:hypothetical protein
MLNFSIWLLIGVAIGWMTSQWGGPRRRVPLNLVERELAARLAGVSAGRSGEPPEIVVVAAAYQPDVLDLALARLRPLNQPAAAQRPARLLLPALLADGVTGTPQAGTALAVPLPTDRPEA